MPWKPGEPEDESGEEPPEPFRAEPHLLTPQADPAQWWVELRYKNSLLPNQRKTCLRVVWRIQVRDNEQPIN